MAHHTTAAYYLTTPAHLPATPHHRRAWLPRGTRSTLPLHAARASLDYKGRREKLPLDTHNTPHTHLYMPPHTTTILHAHHTPHSLPFTHYTGILPATFPFHLPSNSHPTLGSSLPFLAMIFTHTPHNYTFCHTAHYLYTFALHEPL